MNNFFSTRVGIGLLSLVIPITTFAIAVFVSLPIEYKFNVSAQVVDVDEPPTNATEELDVKVDPTEPLPVNGTIIVDITNADDVDLNALPPDGVSIIVTNSTLTVTNNPVEISEEGAGGTPPTVSEGFGTGPSINNDENEVQESSDGGGDGGGGDDDGGDGGDGDDGDDGGNGGNGGNGDEDDE